MYIYGYVCIYTYGCIQIDGSIRQVRIKITANAIVIAISSLRLVGRLAEPLERADGVAAPLQPPQRGVGPHRGTVQRAGRGSQRVGGQNDDDVDDDDDEFAANAAASDNSIDIDADADADSTSIADDDLPLIA